MEQTKAPDASPSEEWAGLPWRKLEQHQYRLQKRIFKASERGDLKAVHKLQKLLMKSRSARLLAVRRVTQDNQGKKTAGIDGVKSVQPTGRLAMVEAIHPRHMNKRKPQPLRRVWIPKPGKTEQRPLGIPVMFDRACQALAKAALEPQWEALFEVNSYGFRPGRGAHDAIGAIFSNIRLKSKYVLDADIKGCFDNINHQALLAKLSTYPAMRRLVKGWLKAGVMEALELSPTKAGTPQGGVVSPLLANIALYGMEEALQKAYVGEKKAPSALRGAPQLIRYADDFVVLHAQETEIIKAQQIIEMWLKGIGLELKPSKTRLSHTLKEYQENVGFNFLGFTIRQFPVGKTHTGKGKTSGFKTIIKPSKEGVQRHLQELRKILQKSQSLPQEELIDQLNPVIHGWALYYRTVVSKRQLEACDHHLISMLWQRMTRKHPKKNAGWVKRKYWRTVEGNNWTFATTAGDKQRTLRWHANTPIQRHVKVKGRASPFDGNLLYWTKRLKNHPLTRTTLGRLLQKQQGKCRWCELYFREEDLIEIDHITPKSEGGGEELSNKCALHRHCHDQRHAKHDAECINDN
ncbi:group II intron reverse transcriptase/maturase [Dictyobacter halimunensis]|uniref:group II intron reverse transcriptase/maturase n=1 Tax=Dictyobacter halimunensis TaxID=3026934 RepID=UPI0030C74E6B